MDCMHEHGTPPLHTSSATVLHPQMTGILPSQDMEGGGSLPTNSGTVGGVAGVITTLGNHKEERKERETEVSAGDQEAQEDAKFNQDSASPLVVAAHGLGPQEYTRGL